MRAKRVLATLAAAALLVTGFDAVTYASTGQSLILGQANKAARTTTLKNTGTGPALKLLTKAGAPPFGVGSTGKVGKLNSDLVDGWDSSAMLNSAIVLTESDTTKTWPQGGAEWSLAGVPEGRYLVTWYVNIAPLPQGSEVFCGLVAHGDNDGWAVATEPGRGPSSAVPLGGSALVPFASESMLFICMSPGNAFRLDSPLTVALQPLAKTDVSELVEIQP